MSNSSRIIAEVNGVEFYTDMTSGECGISQHGLAILCGVSQQAMTRLIKSLENRPKSRFLQTLLKKHDASALIIKTPSGMVLCRAELSIAVILHYASTRKKEANLAFDSFAVVGFNPWVQSITGWQQEKPKQPPMKHPPIHRQFIEIPLPNEEPTPEQIALMSEWIEWVANADMKRIFQLAEKQQQLFHKYYNRHLN